MRPSRPFVLSLALAAGLPLTAALAGPLTPPAGPIAATHRTLTEVEPRTPITTATTPGDTQSVFVISQPGSYYLTSNITGAAGKAAIRVVCDHVTIDLNGFTVRAAPGASIGIADRGNDDVANLRSLTVRNGTIAGFDNGIHLPFVQQVRLESLAVSDCISGIKVGGESIITGCIIRSGRGLNSIGFDIGAASALRDCVAAYCGAGFVVEDSTLDNCVARSNNTGFSAINALLRGCVATGSTSIGISLGRASRAEACAVAGGQVGIEVAARDAVVTRCSVTMSQFGIRVVGPDVSITGNEVLSCGSSTSSVALHVTASALRARIEGNHGTNNYKGLQVDATDCLIVRNSFGRARGGSHNFIIAAGNRVAPIVWANTNGSQIAVGAGMGTVAGSFTGTDPNANINY